MRLFPLSGDDTAITTADVLKRSQINLFKNVIGQASRSYGGTVSTFPGRLELTDLAATRTIMTALGIGDKPSDLQTLFAGMAQWGTAITQAIAARNNQGKMQDTWTPAQPPTVPAGAGTGVVVGWQPPPTFWPIVGVAAGAGVLIWFTMFRK